MPKAESLHEFELGKGVRFALKDDDKNKLYATFEPSRGVDYIDQSWVDAQLDRLGVSEYFRFDAAINELIDKYNFSSQTKTLLIAERRDAQVTLEVSDDKMAAHLTMVPSYAGQPITLDDIKALMDVASISYGVWHDVITSCLDKEEVDRVCVARGDAVVPGQPAKFECLLPKAKKRCPRISEKGSVDYRDLGDIFVVHPGDHLMRRIPADPGKPGRNILGQVMKPNSVNDPLFAAGQVGVDNPIDENLLIATITGQPIVMPNGMWVENTIIVRDVDLSTGHLVFDGSALVTGDVKKTMQVKVSGDVVIKGMLEAAKIEAGGDVTVVGPMIGNGGVRDAQGHLDANTAIIRAQGSVSTSIVEYGYICAGDNVFVAEMALHSELNALNEVIVGASTTAKGQVVGGVVRSGLLVKVLEVGSPVGVLSQLIIGFEPSYQDDMETIDEQISAHHQQLADVKKLIASLSANASAATTVVLKKAINTQQHLALLGNELQTKKNQFKLCVDRLNIGKIMVNRQSYAGVQISINHRVKRINEDMKGVDYALKDNKVVAM